MRTRVHISLGVRDLDASTGFYSALFGAGPTKTKTDYANFRLDAPALHLALVAVGEVAQAPSLPRHYGVELFDHDDLHRFQARAEQAGLIHRLEDQTTCCYAVADKFWAKDPDGNEWEFWVRLSEADAMSEPTQASEGCCGPTVEEASATDQKGCCG